MPIRAVIFDFGGVLMRTEDQSPRQELAARLGVTREQLYYHIFDSPSARQATLGEISAGQHWENVRQALGLSPEEFPAVRAAFWAGDRLDAGLVDYIRSLRPQRKTALLSNAWDDLHGYLVEPLGIADAFDELVISAEVGAAKPDERIYRLALERLDVSPQQAVFVDDYMDNITSASQQGLQAIHFCSTEQTKADLERLLNSTILPE